MLELLCYVLCALHGGKKFCTGCVLLPSAVLTVRPRRLFLSCGFIPRGTRHGPLINMRMAETPHLVRNHSELQPKMKPKDLHAATLSTLSRVSRSGMQRTLFRYLRGRNHIFSQTKVLYLYKERVERGFRRKQLKLLFCPLSFEKNGSL